MTTIKVSEETRDILAEYKVLEGLKSFDKAVIDLVTTELHKYCYTKTGYAKVNDKLVIDNEVYTIIDMAEDFVYARSGDIVTEFHKHGKVAWNAELVNE